MGRVFTFPHGSRRGFLSLRRLAAMSVPFSGARNRGPEFSFGGTMFDAACRPLGRLLLVATGGPGIELVAWANTDADHD